MLNLGCGQYLRNPFFQDFGVKSGGAGFVFLRIILGCIRYLHYSFFSLTSETKFTRQPDLMIMWDDSFSSRDINLPL